MISPSYCRSGLAGAWEENEKPELVKQRDIGGWLVQRDHFRLGNTGADW